MRWLQSLALAVLCGLAVLLVVSGGGTPAVLAQEPEPTATRPPVQPIETVTPPPTIEPTVTPVVPAPPSEPPTSETVVATPVIPLLPESGVTANFDSVVVGIGGLLLVSGLLLVQRRQRG